MRDKCSRCGTEMPPNAPEGLCPRCLGALNLATETVLPGDQPTTAQAPLPPAELAQHFPQLEILGYLGRGGMGVVYKARQKSLNRLVALKLLAPERVQDERFAERFAREAQALAQLNHPNIVTIYDFGQAGGFYFLLMEFVDGVNLRQLLATRKLEPAEALAIVPPVCEALQYAHDHGIVHCDIKPENLLLDKNGRAKIADFGIARIMGAAPSQATEVAGTPQYMAPEQRVDKADHRSDIYSLGVVLYELLTGELPGDKLQPPSRKVLIDVRLDEIVLRALHQTPELRFQTAAEFRTQVETVISAPGAPPRPRAANAPPQMIKVGMSTVTTPERLATFAGQLFHFRTRSHLMLDDRQLSFSRAHTGAMTIIALSAIQDLSIGRYPGMMNPPGITLISLTYDEDGETKRLFFTPYEGFFGFPSQRNALIQEWFDEIQAATVAATGRAPRTTPAEELGVPSTSIALLALFAALMLPGGVAAITLLRLRGGNGQLGWPGIGVGTLVAAALLLPFALALLGQRRNAAKPGRLRTTVMVVLAVVGTFIGLGILMSWLAISVYQGKHALPAVAIAQPRLEVPYADPAISADMLQIRLNQAESELDRMAKLRAENLVSEQEMSQAKFAVELVKAQLSGNPTQVAKVKLNQAEVELDRVSKLHAEKLVSQHEMNQATFNVELRRAELAGDRAKVARVQLAHAEEMFQRAAELREQNLISESDYNQRKAELELFRADVERLPNTPERPDVP